MHRTFFFYTTPNYFPCKLIFFYGETRPKFPLPPTLLPPAFSSRGSSSSLFVLLECFAPNFQLNITACGKGSVGSVISPAFTFDPDLTFCKSHCVCDSDLGQKQAEHSQFSLFLTFCQCIHKVL